MGRGWSVPRVYKPPITLKQSVRGSLRGFRTYTLFRLSVRVTGMINSIPAPRRLGAAVELTIKQEGIKWNTQEMNKSALQTQLLIS